MKLTAEMLENAIEEFRAHAAEVHESIYAAQVLLSHFPPKKVIRAEIPPKEFVQVVADSPRLSIGDRVMAKLRADGPARLGDIIVHLDSPKGSVMGAMTKLVKSKQVKRVGRGKYAAKK